MLSTVEEIMKYAVRRIQSAEGSWDKLWSYNFQLIQDKAAKTGPLMENRQEPEKFRSTIRFCQLRPRILYILFNQRASP